MTRASLQVCESRALGLSQQLQGMQRLVLQRPRAVDLGHCAIGDRPSIVTPPAHRI